MTNDDRDAFYDKLQEHACAHDVVVKAERMQVYFEILKKWEAVEVFAALDRCFFGCARFPTLHDIAKAYHSRHPIL